MHPKFLPRQSPALPALDIDTEAVLQAAGLIHVYRVRSGMEMDALERRVDKMLAERESLAARIAELEQE